MKNTELKELSTTLISELSYIYEEATLYKKNIDAVVKSMQSGKVNIDYKHEL